MKFIEINKNNSTLVSLIDNAEKFVVIVSPYNDFSKLNELKNAINSATDRGVEVNYYVREGEGFNGMEGLKVNLFEVAKLHAKIFFSENEAYISSGNLISRPDINWLCRLNTQEELDELITFFENTIKPSTIKLEPENLHHKNRVLTTV